MGNVLRIVFEPVFNFCGYLINQLVIGLYSLALIILRFIGYSPHIRWERGTGLTYWENFADNYGMLKIKHFEDSKERVLCVTVFNATRQRVTMNQLIVLYLMTSAVYLIPMVGITLTLNFGITIPIFPQMPDDRSSLNRRTRRIGLSLFERIMQLFDWDLKEYLTKLSLVVCVLQLTTIFLIILAIVLEVPLFFIPIINDRSKIGVFYDILIFEVISSAIQLMPMIVLVFALFYRIPLPFMPKLTKKRPPPTDEITLLEQDSENFASIRLTRFENSEKTIIYANCRDERSGKVFKLVLCQGKEAVERPQCFLYTNNESTLEPINPAPVNIDGLDEIFAPGDN